MHIEQETIDFVAIIIGEVDSQFSLKIRRKIARKAILEDKITDTEWLKKALSEEKNDKVFKQFNLIRHKNPFAEAYGKSAFSFMRKYLNDPGSISPRWACHFMSTVKAIGMKIVVAEKDIYGFVTNHPEWINNKKARKFFSTRNNTRREKEMRSKDPAIATASETAICAKH